MGNPEGTVSSSPGLPGTSYNAGNQRTEFTYDGMGRMVSIRRLTNGSEVSFRRFVWCDNDICEERDVSGAVTKRFFKQGVKIEIGPVSGSYFYTRDHLGSVRELTDSSGNVRARYAYEPWGHRSRLIGDLEADFGFAGMSWAAEAGLGITRFRAYEVGRWLSRDPLPKAEMDEGPNLYAYVGDNPVNAVDPLGLCCEKEWDAIADIQKDCPRVREAAETLCKVAQLTQDPESANASCEQARTAAQNICLDAKQRLDEAVKRFHDCRRANKCEPDPGIDCPLTPRPF